MAAPGLLALDFDGVICDTVREGARSAWEVIRPLRGADGQPLPAQALEAFVRLRPTLELGWEFPLLLWAILDGIPEASLLADFQGRWRQELLGASGRTPVQLAEAFDAARDRTIARSLDEWLADQGLYPGMADRLNAALRDGVRLYVITTKEGRFAHRLLEVGGVSLPATQVWGKERRQPKPELLRVLRRQEGVDLRDIWFVEDRLKTLQAVTAAPDLAPVGLFLAGWGYVMPADQAAAAADPRIVPLSLETFCGDFSGWRT